jgi:hypothetical protein
MLKKFLIVLALAVFSTGIAKAQTACSATGLGAGSALISTSVVTCGTLTFSDFSVMNPTGGAAGVVDFLGTSEWLNGTAYLQMNPNLQMGEDEQLLFQVAGGVNQIDLTVGGVNASVNEKACVNPITTTGPVAFNCSNAAHTGTIAPLGAIAAGSGTINQPVFSTKFPTTDPIYIFKDIQTGPGGALSEFTESFETGSATPEPGSLMLFGTGLIGLGGLLRKRNRAARVVAAA